MHIYRVTLINVPQVRSGYGEEHSPRFFVRKFCQTINVADDECILDRTVEQGIRVPYKCASGACAVCQCKIVSGTVDQSEQMILSDCQITEGYILPCIAKPTSDCIIEIELD